MADGFIPSKDECFEILKKHNTPEKVIQHCLTVNKIAEEFCSKILDLDKQLIIAGSMLHDIGRAVDHSIFHAVRGVEILREERIDKRILSIVQKHIGTGITEEEARILGLPLGDYIPRTAEEIVVSYSDNLVCGDRRCSFEETLNDFISKFGPESHVVKGFHKQKELVEKMILQGRKG